MKFKEIEKALKEMLIDYEIKNLEREYKLIQALKKLTNNPSSSGVSIKIPMIGGNKEQK